MSNLSRKYILFSFGVRLLGTDFFCSGVGGVTTVQNKIQDNNITYYLHIVYVDCSAF